MAEKEDLLKQELFLKEEIPDSATLFYRVHRSYVRSGLKHNIFTAKEGAMSTDWCRYSSAESARLRSKTPSENGIVAFNAGKLRALLIETPSYNLEVDHSPIQPNNSRGLPPNQAHTNVRTTNCQIDETAVRYKLWEICGKKWSIDIDEQVCHTPPATCSS
jgi:hypothetical protein